LVDLARDAVRGGLTAEIREVVAGGVRHPREHRVGGCLGPASSPAVRPGQIDR
jgi:hypothetical protein